MKKIMALLAATVLCVGCSSSPRGSQSTPNNTPSANYQGGNNGNDNNGYENDYNPFEGMTYGDYVRLYRNDIISGAKSVTYQQLARSSNALLEEFVKLKGQVGQVIDQSVGGYSYVTVMIDMLYETYSDDYGVILLQIPKEFVSSRPLVGDVITIWGLSMGFDTVETVLGLRSMPCIAVAKMEIIDSGYGY